MEYVIYLLHNDVLSKYVCENLRNYLIDNGNNCKVDIFDNYDVDDINNKKITPIIYDVNIKNYYNYIFPKNSIIINTERNINTEDSINKYYIKYLSQFEIYDTDLRNVKIFEKNGANKVKYLKFGCSYIDYDTLNIDGKMDIDVLFVGYLTERRINILNYIRKRLDKNINIVAISDIDVDKIKRSKIILNIHENEEMYNNIYQIYYLISNKKIILSEYFDDNVIFESIVYFDEYEYMHLIIHQILNETDFTNLLTHYGPLGNNIEEFISSNKTKLFNRKELIPLKIIANASDLKIDITKYIDKNLKYLEIIEYILNVSFINKFKEIIPDLHLHDGYAYIKLYKEENKAVFKYDKNTDTIELLCPKDFDYLKYINSYDDLTHLDENSAKQHYVNHGIFENRTYKNIGNLPEDFNWKTYIQFNKDLSNLNENEAIKHFICYGFNEGRKYKLPDDFNVKKYSILNPDLSTLNENALIKHYIEFGVNEDRKYKLDTDLYPNFNWKDYIKLYSYELNIYNEHFAKNHYLSHGISENRICSEQHFLDKYPYFNMNLYKLYLGVNLNKESYYVLYNENPIFINIVNNNLYHVDVNYVKHKYKYDIKYITDNLISINDEKKCCKKCKFLDSINNNKTNVNINNVDIDLRHLFYDVNLQTQGSSIGNQSISNYYNIMYNNYINISYKYLIVYTIGCFYEETLQYIHNKLISFNNKEILIVIAINNHIYDQCLDFIAEYKKFENCIIIMTHNKGYDIGQFFLCLDFIEKSKIKYNYMIKIHSKRYCQWMKDLVDPLLLNKKQLSRLIRQIKKYDIHYYGNNNYNYNLDLNNYKILDIIVPDLYIKNIYNNYKFIAGTMFLCSSDYISKFKNIVPLDKYLLFQTEYTRNNRRSENSIPHAIERLFGVCNTLNYLKEFIVIMATYINSDIKMQTVKNNISFLIQSGMKHLVIILTSDLPFNNVIQQYLVSLHINVYIYTYENDSHVDFGKYYKYLKYNIQFISNYKFYVFINDSIILTSHITKFLSNCNLNYLYAYNDSNEGSLHYQSFLFSVKNINKFYNILDHKLNLCDSFIDIINHIEKKLHLEYFQHSCHVNCTNYTDDNIFFRCDEFYNSLLTNDILPIIKIKRLYTTKYNLNDNNILPIDFHPQVYKSLHNDLTNLANNDDIINHFINHGIYEGRMYKKNQKSNIPDFIINKLKNIKFVFDNI